MIYFLLFLSIIITSVIYDYCKKWYILKFYVTFNQNVFIFNLFNVSNLMTIITSTTYAYMSQYNAVVYTLYQHNEKNRHNYIDKVST